MIAVKRLNNEELVINADLIESIESVPDTIISLTTGRKITVKDSIEEVIKKIIKYKQTIHCTVNVVTKEEKKA